MKSKILSALLISTISAPLYATDHTNWYTGAEVIQSNQDYKKGFGKRVFQKNPQSFAAFGGVKFSEYLGTEFGFEYQPQRNKTALLTAGDASPGTAALTNGQSGVFRTSIRQSHAYIGLFAESVHKKTAIGKVRFQFLVAASISQVKAQTIPLFADGLPISPAASETASRNYSKRKLLPMIKISMINNFTHNFGMRLSANYRNMGKVKSFSKTPNSIAQIKLKDSFGVGLGLVYLCG